MLRLVVECTTAQTLDRQRRLDAPRRWGSSVCAAALNTSCVLTGDSSHLHTTPSVLKLDACCSAKHELPVLRRRRGGEAAGAGGTRGNTRPSVDEGCWRWRRFGRYGGHVGRGWRRRWPHGHGPVHAVSYLYVVQKVTCMLFTCMLSRHSSRGGGERPSANNPQEFMTKAAQAIPAEVHMFR